MSEIKIEDYEQYWQKGGTYVLTIEVFNDLFYDIEQLQQENEELKEQYSELEDKYIKNQPCCNEDDCALYKEYLNDKNILTEFEKWLEEEIEKINNLINPKKDIKPYGEELNILETIRNVYMDCKDELQELKDGKKLQGE